MAVCGTSCVVHRGPSVLVAGNQRVYRTRQIPHSPRRHLRHPARPSDRVLGLLIQNYSHLAWNRAVRMLPKRKNAAKLDSSPKHTITYRYQFSPDGFPPGISAPEGSPLPGVETDFPLFCAVGRFEGDRIFAGIYLHVLGTSPYLFLGATSRYRVLGRRRSIALRGHGSFR